MKKEIFRLSYEIFKFTGLTAFLVALVGLLMK